MALTWHSQDNDGWTVLHAASMKVKLEIAQLLLEKGADVNIQGANSSSV
jgi:ankyrin repeat protein